jgi:hypothetical protein
VKALFRGYLTGKDYYGRLLINGWSSSSIRLNWSDNALRDWAHVNGIPPNSTQEIFRSKQLPIFGFDGFVSNISGKRVQTFRELTLHFKNLFHLRADNSLIATLLRINQRNEWDKEIEFSIQNFSKNIELFTDVDKLITAFTRVIALILEQHAEDAPPKVELSFFEREKSTIFSIRHINSTYKKSIQSTADRMGQTYTNLINRQINGVCNFYVRADFNSEGVAEINLWNGTKRAVTRNGLEDFSGGVEHILEFTKH